MDYGELFPQCCRDICQESIARITPGHDEMGCKRRFSGAHGPDVQIMDGSDFRQVAQVLTHRICIDVIRDAMQNQPGGLFQQGPGGQNNERADDQAYA